MSVTIKLASEPPEQLVLRPAKGKRLRLSTTSVAFTLFGVSMIGTGHGKMGWLMTLLFGLGTVVFAIELLRPGASYLELSPDGFVVCALFRPSPLIRWDTVSGFRVVRAPLKGTKMVGFDIDASFRPSLGAMSRGLTGATGGGLPDTYGRKPDELADLMNKWRRKALWANSRQCG